MDKQLAKLEQTVLMGELQYWQIGLINLKVLQKQQEVKQR